MRIFSVLVLQVIAHIWDIIRANGATREMPRTVDGGAYKHRACEVRGVSCVMCILCELYTALYRTLPRILYTQTTEQRSHTNTKHRACTVHRTDGTSCQSFDWELYHGVSPWGRRSISLVHTERCWLATWK